jgi:8-oxo-dGTP diphosphatase
MIKATLGFIYTPLLDQVLLIQKSKPVFHKGLLNGLGGKTDPGETAAQCIAREVQEESGLVIQEEDWLQIGSLKWTEWSVDVLVAKYSGDQNKALSLTGDPVTWYETNKLPANVVSNLNWLIPLGIDCLKQQHPPQVVVTYQEK